MIDVGFPVINYLADETPSKRGEKHGEMFREAILELVEIRTQLMREKNSKLTDGVINDLALQQWEVTRGYDSGLTEELEGIRLGANISVEQLVILNNYTDFRDIQMDDQGCSMVYLGAEAKSIAGQTWDMHGSAKNYVCCLDIVQPDGTRQLVFSIVGCVGMMGYSSGGLMIGVNNINTDGARAGAMWPVVVRKVLAQKTKSEMIAELTAAPVTSGHNYLLADKTGGEMWEVLPGLSEKVLDSSDSKSGKIFHTNHCLGEKASQREQVISQNSTTYVRYDLLAKKIDSTNDLKQTYDLLNDHENYPKAICSNFQTDTQDPSITCGGAVGDLIGGHIKMWRGDAEHDKNFVCHEFELGN